MSPAGEAVDAGPLALTPHDPPAPGPPALPRATPGRVFTSGGGARHIREQAPDVVERVSVVQPGEVLDLGLRVELVGEKHAVIHPELPRFDNSGFFLTAEGTTVFHPGDALTVPPTVPDLLMLPVSAPWLKVSECIDYAREVGAPRSLAIHDAVYSEAGLGIVDGHLGRFLAPREQEYVRLAAGGELTA